MKKLKYVRMLVAVIGLLGVGAAADAEDRSEMVVALPFDFVVSGKTLPAGTYTVSRVSDDRYDGLILSSYGRHASVLVRPIEIEGASADKPQVSFERAREQHFLSTIQTARDVYNIPVSRSVIREAAARLPKNTPDSGSSGSN
jgi:hypothetical protein